MALPSEELVKEVWSAMWAIQHHARHENVPGSIRDFGDMASRCFECWFTIPGTLKSFACGVLSGPTDCLATTGRLPTGTAEACWRFITLLESIRDGRL